MDTSVWSYLLADHLPRERAITRALIETAPQQHALFVSALVLDELNATAEAERRRRLLGALNDASPTRLEGNAEVESVSTRLMELKVLTRRAIYDATHIAFAIVHGMDALVSWDTRDIVNLRSKRGVSAVCRLQGYRELELITPEQV